MTVLVVANDESDTGKRKDSSWENEKKDAENCTKKKNKTEKNWFENSWKEDADSCWKTERKYGICRGENALNYILLTKCMLNKCHSAYTHKKPNTHLHHARFGRASWRKIFTSVSCDADYLPKLKRVFSKEKKRMAKKLKSWVFILFSLLLFIWCFVGAVAVSYTQWINYNLYWHLPATPATDYYYLFVTPTTNFFSMFFYLFFLSDSKWKKQKTCSTFWSVLLNDNGCI